MNYIFQQRKLITRKVVNKFWEVAKFYKTLIKEMMMAFIRMHLIPKGMEDKIYIYKIINILAEPFLIDLSLGFLSFFQSIIIGKNMQHKIRIFWSCSRCLVCLNCWDQREVVSFFVSFFLTHNDLALVEGLRIFYKHPRHPSLPTESWLKK